MHLLKPLNPSSSQTKWLICCDYVQYFQANNSILLFYYVHYQWLENKPVLTWGEQKNSSKKISKSWCNVSIYHELKFSTFWKWSIWLGFIFREKEDSKVHWYCKICCILHWYYITFFKMQIAINCWPLLNAVSFVKYLLWHVQTVYHSRLYFNIFVIYVSWPVSLNKVWCRLMWCILLFRGWIFTALDCRTAGAKSIRLS